MMSLIMTNVATNVIATQTTPLMTTTMSHSSQELKMARVSTLLYGMRTHFCSSVIVSLKQISFSQNKIIVNVSVLLHSLVKMNFLHSCTVSGLFHTSSFITRITFHFIHRSLNIVVLGLSFLVPQPQHSDVDSE